ncbi:MAG TPA: nicotinamide-nucleotide amidohydrolase family protein, partial [Gemmatimonadales bacterium]|nr:nicotinamide-nucleotide amidohydrolase family protein [Gemmatimonadales bacterium]
LLRTTGIPESALAERLGHVEPEIAPVSLAYLPGLEGVDLRLSAWDLAGADADRLLRAAADLIRGRAGEHVYGEGVRDLAELVLEAARSKGLQLAVAESCTGGLVGTRLTEIPGSSDVFVGGVIAYDNAVKRDVLDVPAAVLEQHGAVSEPAARAMVDGLTRRFQVPAAVSVTGIAGPGGGSEAKPVGTVWISCLVHGAGSTRRFLFPGTRHEIRARAAQAALHLLLRQINAGSGA